MRYVAGTAVALCAAMLLLSPLVMSMPEDMVGWHVVGAVLGSLGLAIAPAGRQRWVAFGLVAATLIVALVTSVAVAGRFQQQRRARAYEAVVRNDAGDLASAIRLFRSDVGRYPTEGEGPAALVAPPPGAPGWRGPYVPKVPHDPWGRPYQFRAGPHDTLEVFSTGPDGVASTADDVAACSVASEAAVPATRRAPATSTAPR